MKPTTHLRLLSISAIASSAIFFASCGEKKTADAETGTEPPAAEQTEVKQDTTDSLTDELIEQFNKLGETMLSAKDKASAEEAAKSLVTIGDEIEAIAARLDKLETPSDEERNRLHEKMENASKSMSDKMGNALQGIMGNQEVAQVLGPAFMELGARMNELNPVFERFGKKKEAQKPAPPAAPAPAPEAAAPAAPAPVAQ